MIRSFQCFIQAFRGLKMIKKITLDHNRILNIEPFAFKVNIKVKQKNSQDYFVHFKKIFLKFMNKMCAKNAFILFFFKSKTNNIYI